MSLKMKNNMNTKTVRTWALDDAKSGVGCSNDGKEDPWFDLDIEMRIFF